MVFPPDREVCSQFTPCDTTTTTELLEQEASGSSASAPTPAPSSGSIASAADYAASEGFECVDVSFGGCLQGASAFSCQSGCPCCRQALLSQAPASGTALLPKVGSAASEDNPV